MSKFLNKADDRRTRLRKIAADGNGFNFGKLLQDRNVRTGLVGLGTAGLSKLFGAGWGTSALLGLGAGAAAHYGQKAYGKWDAQRKYDALSHEDKLKLEKAKQDKLYVDANAATQNNKKQLAAKQEADRKRTELENAKAETAKIQNMTPEQRSAYAAQQAADRELDAEIARGQEEALEMVEKETKKAVYGPKIAKLRAELARRDEAARRKTEGFFDYKFGDSARFWGNTLGITRLVDNIKANRAEAEKYDRETQEMRKQLADLERELRGLN